jgi:hypothetical protein
MESLCAACELATSAGWSDFRKLAVNEYTQFRKAGGEGFVALWIPHAGEDGVGHLSAVCPGEYCVIFGYESGEIRTTLYDSKGEVASWDLPWAVTDLFMLDTFDTSIAKAPWLEPGEGHALILAVDIVARKLQDLGEDPTDAYFAVPDWVLHYE